MDGWKLQKSVFQNKKLTLPSLVKADRAKEFWKLMTVKRRCYSSTLFSLFMNASQIQQEFWTYFLCFLSIKTQHSLSVIGWLLTSLSNCINNDQHLSWRYCSSWIGGCRCTCLVQEQKCPSLLWIQYLLRSATNMPFSVYLVDGFWSFPL